MASLRTLTKKLEGCRAWGDKPYLGLGGDQNMGSQGGQISGGHL